MSAGSGSLRTGSSSTTIKGTNPSTDNAADAAQDTNTNNSDSTSSRTDSLDDEALELWLSISIPFVLFLTVFVLLVFCCKRPPKNDRDVNVPAGSPSLPMYQIGRRRGTPTSRMATLTMEDEEALAPWRLNAESITPIRPLGAGAYGTVWLATYLGETVVVKKLSPPLPTSLPRTKSWRKNSRHSRQSSNNASGATSGTTSRTRTKSRSLRGQSALRRFVAEIRFLACLSHPKVVAFYGAAWVSPLKAENGNPEAGNTGNAGTGNASDLQMVLEYMSGGDLRQYLVRTRHDARARAWRAPKLAMALDIAEALTYLHSRQPKPILHRDLKSRNILLDSAYTAKVADFGMSRYGLRHLLEGEKGGGEDEGQDDKDDSTEQLAMTRSIGTNRWIAPEVLSGDARYSTAVDIYSFGVILSELDSHELPFSEVTLSNGQSLPESAVLELLRTGAIRPSLSDRCPREVATLVMECLTLEPSRRPTAAQVAERLRSLLERERRVSDIGDDVSTSDQNSFLGAREDLGSIFSSSVGSSSLSMERGFNYAVLGER
uniref:Protein kinase domain-containing protein n=1 Tax=Hyaloperonospora arabidopsidis (strain Emoy2) TaxID=559515 RepID=M4BM19_HYAAE